MEIKRSFSVFSKLMAVMAMGIFLLLASATSVSAAAAWTGSCTCGESAKSNSAPSKTFEAENQATMGTSVMDYINETCDKQTTDFVSCTIKENAVDKLVFTKEIVPAARQKVQAFISAAPADQAQPQYAGICTCTFVNPAEPPTTELFSGVATAHQLKSNITQFIEGCFGGEPASSVKCTGTQGGTELYTVDATGKDEALTDLQEKSVSSNTPTGGTAAGGATTDLGTGSGWGMDGGNSGLEWVKPDLELPIEGLGEFVQPEEGPCSGNLLQVDGKCIQIPWIAQYLKAIFFWGLGIGALLAVMLLAFGGIMYISAGAMPGNIAKAKEYMFSGVYGLLILLGSYILLNTINPRLVNLYPIEIEVVKKQIIEDNVALFCEEMIQKYKAPDYQLTLEAFDPATAKCGDGRTYKVSLKDSKGQILTLTNPTCSSNNCGSTTTKNCVMGLETTKYSCEDVIVYGRVLYPDMFNLLECGQTTQAMVKSLTGSDSAFYLDEVQLRAADGSEKDIKLSPEIDVGRRNMYHIPRTLIDTAKWDALSDKALIYLWVDIVDASNFSGISFDDAFYAIPDKPNKDLPNAKFLTPVTMCLTAGGYNFSVVRQVSTGGVLATGISPITKEQMKNTASYWDLDITNSFFECAKADTLIIPTTSSTAKWWDLGNTALEAVGAYDVCKYASQTGEGTSKFGEVCLTGNDCVIPKVSTSILMCLPAPGGKQCLPGAWGVSCKEGGCSYGFSCDTVSSYAGVDSQTCVITTAGYLQACDPENKNPCIAGLSCIKNPYTCSTEGTPAAHTKLGCSQKFTSQKEVMYPNICLPVTVDGNAAQVGSCVCGCESDADCASVSTAQHCVTTFNNDFCSSGKTGSYCDDDTDCNNPLSCIRNHCAYYKGYYSDKLDQFKPDSSWTNYFIDPVSNSQNMKSPY